MKLQGKLTYLATLEKEDCVKLWQDFEYDFEQMTEPLNIGHSAVKAEEWFSEIQKTQGDKHIRLGIFLPKGEVIGDIALQDIDWKNRSCSVGYGIARIANRGKGYGSDALKTILEYAFSNVGLERVWARTLEHNIGSQRVLEKCGFTLEGRERKAEYFAGKRFDKLVYGILSEEFRPRD